ncbi:hypothetical protein K504DRAFT_216096 [Pleomassaria siparia CBS 279.74]|uniref:Uncharacterized protein n=1 Tax=Pleomassaria siparia CBS 279.74 TaxID=1314801 RepID=A0A6G1KF68_9PLEO|nr:hypothetical protein K504DRAFT_216096 [Pleomassaria siparia CBS 279.74]
MCMEGRGERGLEVLGHKNRNGPRARLVDTRPNIYACADPSASQSGCATYILAPPSLYCVCVCVCVCVTVTKRSVIYLLPSLLPSPPHTTYATRLQSIPLLPSTHTQIPHTQNFNITTSHWEPQPDKIFNLGLKS